MPVWTDYHGGGEQKSPFIVSPGVRDGVMISWSGIMRYGP